MSAEERAARSAAADALVAEAFDAVHPPDAGVAMVAVGGYGRGELAPCSDLDLVLVHEADLEPGEWAHQVWYPLWDSGTRIDHAVRTLPQMVAAAADDVKVAVGLLDVRHVAGDPNLTLRLRATVLADWRRHARDRLPDLRSTVSARHRSAGELAHAAVPDVKEAAGGLRDAVVIHAVRATWLVDVPAADLERCRQQLLDVRDVLHQITGRPVDRIAPEHWSEVGLGLGLTDERAAQRHVRELGRRLRHLSRLVWRRADDALRRGSAARPRRPELVPLAPGVSRSRSEVVLARDARPDQDPVLLLRAAAHAAANDLVLAPATAARLARRTAEMPPVWPTEARQQLVRLLAAGPGLLPVWETLEETDALARFLPEWERIRLLPHASVIHRFTVDRHVVETCIEASALIRGVSRPDVLMVAALLHDIGKGELVDHSVAGAPIARGIAQRMGFDAAEVGLIETLVRHHLLLAAVATSRDPEDPGTIAAITDHITDVEALDLLVALTEADAKATAAKAWSSWRAGLIHDLARRVRAVLESGTVPRPLVTEEIEVPATARDELYVVVTPVPDGSRVTVAGPDRVGLLADVAAMFALRRIPVRAARVWSQDEYGVSVWDVAESHLDSGALRDVFDSVVSGRTDPRARLALRRAPGDLAPAVVVRPDASRVSTVLEVRAADRPGVIHLVCAALASLDLSVRSAHVSTLGPQAVDVFYVHEPAAGALTDARASAAAQAIRARLAGDDGTP